MKRLSFIVSILLLYFNICQCKTLHVPSEYSTIQSAINAAQNSDTVLVSEGTYYENIRYNRKNIVIASQFIFTKDWQTVQNTIIDGSKCLNKDTASVVFFYKQDSTAVLEGFTITGGGGTKHVSQYNPQEGGGIYLDSSYAIIRNNYITQNTIRNPDGTNRGGGGGISTFYGNPTINNDIIVSNTSGYAGGIVLNWSKGKVKNNLIYHNIATLQYGAGGLMVWQAPEKGGIVENNTIIGNKSTTAIAGAISISVPDASMKPVIKNNIIWGNRQVTGKQIDYPQYLTGFNDVEDYSSGTNISVNPQLLENSFISGDNSPCIDAGDTSELYNDVEDLNNSGRALFPSKGTLRNDIGAFGGPFAEILPQLNINDLYFRTNLTLIGKAGEEGVVKIEVLNISSSKEKTDSISFTNKDFCSAALNLNGKILNMFESDTVYINYKISKAGTFYDTVMIYHEVSGLENPAKIALTFYISPVTGLQEKKINPGEFKLYQCYPNPFNPSTKIMFNLPAATHVILKVYDILGNEISEIINKEMNSGMHNVTWYPDPKISSGVYLINFVAGNFTETKKIIYQK